MLEPIIYIATYVVIAIIWSTAFKMRGDDISSAFGIIWPVWLYILLCAVIIIVLPEKLVALLKGERQ